MLGKEDLLEQKQKGRLCVIVENRIYDLTDFKDKHPGGHKILERYNGFDASRQFQIFKHGEKAKEMMKQYEIGMNKDQYYTWEQIQEMKGKTIILIDDKVLDVTEFINEHPGGDEIIKYYKNQIATIPFYNIEHSESAKMKLENYRIGLMKKEKENNSTKRWLFFLFGILITYIYKLFK